MAAELSKVRQSAKSSGRLSELQELLDLAQKARRWYLNNTRWSISVRSDDRLYDVAHHWFTEGAVSARPPKALAARYTQNGQAVSSTTFFLEDDSNATPIVDIELFYNETRERTIYIDGHRIRVQLQKPENAESGGMGSNRPSPEVLNFYAATQAGQTAVADMLRKLAQVQTQRKPALHLLDRWADWRKRDDLPTRSLESVVLAAGQMERLKDDLESFLASEKEYVRRGLPWHRGYLLHGPPGCGKTSVIRALASSLGLHLWYAPLSDLEKDTSLLTLISSVGPRSVLLLEDIDVLHAARQRDDNKHASITMAGLLNALDGVATPHGLITFMTTNNHDWIDPALLRPGRIDVQELINTPVPEQLARLWGQFYGKSQEEIADAQLGRLKSFNGTTADAIEEFKQRPDNSFAGFEALTSFAARWRDSESMS